MATTLVARAAILADLESASPSRIKAATGVFTVRTLILPSARREGPDSTAFILRQTQEQVIALISCSSPTDD